MDLWVVWTNLDLLELARRHAGIFVAHFVQRSVPWLTGSCRLLRDRHHHQKEVLDTRLRRDKEQEKEAAHHLVAIHERHQRAAILRQEPLNAKLARLWLTHLVAVWWIHKFPWMADPMQREALRSTLFEAEALGHSGAGGPGGFNSSPEPASGKDSEATKRAEEEEENDDDED